MWLNQKKNSKKVVIIQIVKISHEIILTKNYLESLIEKYQRKNNFLVINHIVPAYYRYSILKEKIDMGSELKVIIEEKLFQELKQLKRVPNLKVHKSDINLSFYKDDEELAKKIIFQAFLMHLENKTGKNIPNSNFNLSKSAFKLSKEIFESNLINDIMYERLSKNLFPKKKPSELTQRESSDLKSLLNRLKYKNDFNVEKKRMVLETNYIEDFLEIYLKYYIKKSKDFPIFISDVKELLFEILFDLNKKYVSHIEEFKGHKLSKNLVFLIFDNLGYLDFLSSSYESDIWLNLMDENLISINPIFSSFITKTDYALNSLTESFDEEKSLTEKIIDKMIDIGDFLTILTCSQWKKNNPYNRILFESNRSGIIRFPNTIFSLNKLKKFHRDLKDKHFLIIYSGIALSHGESAPENKNKNIENNVIRIIKEAVEIFPESTIVALGDHGVQWENNKISKGEKFEGNIRISKSDVGDYSLGKISLKDLSIDSLTKKNEQIIFPLKPNYTLEVPKSKLAHGGFSFSEIIVPLIIVSSHKRVNLLEENAEDEIKSTIEEEKRKREIVYENVKDIILYYLEENGPSSTSEIINHVNEIKKNQVSEQMIVKYIRDNFEFGYIKKGVPTEELDINIRYALWYLPKHQGKYKKYLKESENEILDFLKEKKVCTINEARSETGYDRNYVSSILYRLESQKKIKRKNFKNIYFVNNSLIDIKSKVFYIPKYEEIANKKIEYIQNKAKIERKNEKINRRCDLISQKIKELKDFQVPKVIKNSAISMAKKVDAKGKSLFEILGATIYLSFRKQNIAIPLTLIGEAVLRAKICFKKKELANEIYDKKLSLTRKSINRIEKEIIRNYNFEIEYPKPVDYLNYISLILESPLYIIYFSKLIWNKLNKKNLLGGKHPLGIFSGIIYFIKKNLYKNSLCGSYFSQKDLASKLEVTEVTIRNSRNMITHNSNYLPSLHIKKYKNQIKDKNDNSKINIIIKEGMIYGKDLVNVENIISDLIRTGSVSEDLKDQTLSLNFKNKQNFKDNFNIALFYSEEILSGIINKKIKLILSINPILENFNPKNSKILLFQNSIDRNLRIINSPKIIINNVPLSIAENFIQFTGMEPAEFYIMTRDKNYVNLILLDTNNIEEYNTSLFDFFSNKDYEKIRKSFSISNEDFKGIEKRISQTENQIDIIKEEEVSKEKTPMEKFQKWLRDTEPKKKKKLELEESTEEFDKHEAAEAEDVLNKDLESSKIITSLEKPQNYEILMKPKNSIKIIKESLETKDLEYFHASLDTLFTSLERILYNYHSKFIRSSERLNIYEYLGELWSGRYISLELREQLNLLSRRRNEVKHGREEVTPTYFKTYFPLIIDSIKRLCYHYYKIRVIHKILEKLREIKFIKDHSMIPIKNSPDILEKWLFKKPKQFNIYEREETKNNINNFNFVLEFFTKLLRDKKARKFYFKLEIDANIIENKIKINKIEKLD